MKKTLFKKSMAWLLALMMVITFMPTMAFAEAGDPPANDKSVSSNGDGTFTIELSVTGDADPVEEEAGGVNIVIVYDH